MKKIVLIIVCFFALTSISKAQHSHTNRIHSKGYAALGEEGTLVPFEFDRKPIGDNDILIDILYSGICHSDIHYLHNDWERSIYPLVPGHEIVGKVVQVGKDVTKFKIGDIAGVGCMINSCGICDMCKAGEEQFCENKKTVFTYSSPDWEDNGKSTMGGYANNIVVNENFGIAIPEGAPLDKIAPPFMCRYYYL